MNDPMLRSRFGDQLIDTRQAALLFNLPLYWLSQAKERAARQIPHYRVGKLVRFKPHELEAWMYAQQAARGEGAQDA